MGLDGYSFMIVANYFKTIGDFKNGTMVCKKFEETMVKFHYNPISLTKKTRKYFPNLETLFIYKRDDTKFGKGKIKKYKFWYLVDYAEYLRQKEKGNECMRVVYTKNDRIKYGNKIPIEITCIGSECFMRSSVEEIVIPPRVQVIQREAFKDCQYLKSVQIPKYVTFIGDYCFDGCRSLGNIELPQTIKTIENMCFNICEKLKTITIPHSVTEIKYGSFKGCVSLSDISFSTRLEIIRDQSFCDCCSLKTIELPKSLSQFSDGSFSNCNKLLSLTIPSLVTSLPYMCFSNCTSLETVFLQSSLQAIKSYTFRECSNLSSITIPTTISFIGEHCFYGCEKLKDNKEIPTERF